MKSYRSFAKINLHLEVLGRRPDGYHELRTVFQTVDLGDELRLERRSVAGIELRVEGGEVPADSRNLAYRAARRFLDTWAGAHDGVAIELRKAVPIGGGLGGGSANAATVLRALAELFGVKPSAEWEHAVAAELGADVPFFLVGGTAIGSGRGDRLIELPDAPAPRGELVLVLPPWPLSTAEVFGAVEASASLDLGTLRWPPPDVDVADFDAWIGRNDLEAAAFRVRPELGALYTSVVRSGARRVRMSGSGSALVALFDDEGDAARAARSWPPDVNWKRIRTLGREAWQAACGFGPATRGA